MAVGLAVAGAQDVPAGDLPPETSGGPVTVSGVVLNGDTGHAVARALVSVAGDRTHAALTDGEGKFSIPAVPSGHRTMEVAKPGFTETPGELSQSSTHNVTVEAAMPSLTFTLYPTNVLTGHISLSTGAAAVGMGIRLLRRLVVNGHERWSIDDVHQTTPSSEFRFYGRGDGTYLLATKPEFDNNMPVREGCPADGPSFLMGYPETFYSDGRDVAGATRISLRGGRSEDVNLAVSLTRFQMVHAAVQRAPAGSDWKYSFTLFEQDGHDAGYALEEQKDHSVCGYLPDGAYTLLVVAERRGGEEGGGGGVRMGSVSFSVEGQPRRELRVALGVGAATPVRVRYEPRAPEQSQPAGPGGYEPVDAATIAASRVGAMTNEPAVTAETEANGEMRMPPASPGSYWVEVTAERASTCLGSATVTGQSLARAPWAVGASGAGSPIDIVLRTDCAKLKVILPASATADGPGEHAPFHVYAVPRFETLGGVPEIEMESGDGEFEGLTPGSYRVYVTRVAVSGDPRDPASLEQLGAGKDVDVAPDSTSSVILEAPGR